MDRWIPADACIPGDWKDRGAEKALLGIRARCSAEPPASYHRLPRVPEAHVVRIWEKAVREHRRFPCADGGIVEVVFPGTPNKFDGPDFTGAVLRVNGRTLRGEIEIHTFEEDWSRHGHDGDPRYKDVILHVAMFPSRSSPLLPTISTIILAEALARPYRSLWAEILQGEITPPLPPCKGWGVTRKGNLVEAMLVLVSAERFRRKIARAERSIEEWRFRYAGAEAEREAFHELSARAFGYGGNEELFERLAGRFPLTEISRLAGKGCGEIVRVFLEETKGWFFRRKGVRPVNRAVKRIKQFSVWSVSELRGGWFETLEGFVRSGTVRHESLIGFVSEAARDEQSGVPALGADRAKEICVNVLAPFFAARARRLGDVEMLRAGLVLYHRLPAAPGNWKTRALERCLPLPNEMSGVRQGCIELYDRFCSVHACGECLLGKACFDTVTP
ncbi:MAG: DUF2851 family protein [Bacteroidota bacterium]|nr:DUF2851 family protein [Bacteroidota bacterium]